MSILDAQADSLQAAALNSFTAAPPRPGAPEPGLFKNTFKGAGSYFMRGMAEAGRAVSMAGAGAAVLIDKVAGDDNYSGASMADRYFKVHNDVFGSAVDYWTPKPGEVGAVGQVMGSLGSGLVQFLANPVLAVGTSALSTSEDLVRQGVNAGPALAAGGIAGAAYAAGMAVPFLGQTLAQRVGSGVAGNLALGAAQAVATHGVLQAAGAPRGVADQFNWADPTARTVDVLMGLAFGGKAHWDVMRAARAKAFSEGGIPSQRSAVADAAAQAFEPHPMTATQRDAVMVMNSGRHLDEAAGPWMFGSAEHTAAVDGIRTAVGQIASGRVVDVQAVRGGVVAVENPHADAMAAISDEAMVASGKPVPQPDMRAPDAIGIISDQAGSDGPPAGINAAGPVAPKFADDLRLPTAEFDPATGQPRTISANEHIAQAFADAEHVKANADGLMQAAATCLLGGV